VTSLRWVSPGAATESVTPIFHENTDITVGQFYGVTLFISSSKKLTTFFAHHRQIFIYFTRVSPPWRVSPRTFFYLSDLVCPLFSINLSTYIFPSGVTPMEGVTRGGPPPPLVTPLPGRFLCSIDPYYDVRCSPSISTDDQEFGPLQ